MTALEDDDLQPRILNRDERYRATHREERRLYMIEYRKTHKAPRRAPTEEQRQRNYLWRHTTAMGATAANRWSLRKAGVLSPWRPPSGAPLEKIGLLRHMWSIIRRLVAKEKT